MERLKSYLNPNKLKLISKGVDSVISRVLNLEKKVEGINHDHFCDALEKAFLERWTDKQPVKKLLNSEELLKIDKLNEIF